MFSMWYVGYITIQKYTESKLKVIELLVFKQYNKIIIYFEWNNILIPNKVEIDFSFCT
jgi:hypothetical protein